jgi:chromosome segregation ATPase
MTRDEANQAYSQTCAELGDLVYKVLDLRDQRASIEDAIADGEQKIAAYRQVRMDLQKALQEAEAVPPRGEFKYVPEEDLAVDADVP